MFILGNLFLSLTKLELYLEFIALTFQQHGTLKELQEITSNAVSYIFQEKEELNVKNVNLLNETIQRMKEEYEQNDKSKQENARRLENALNAEKSRNQELTTR